MDLDVHIIWFALDSYEAGGFYFLAKFFKNLCPSSRAVQGSEASVPCVLSILDLKITSARVFWIDMRRGTQVLKDMKPENTLPLSSMSTTEHLQYN